MNGAEGENVIPAIGRDVADTIDEGIYRSPRDDETALRSDDRRSTRVRRAMRNRRFESNESLLRIVERRGILELEEGAPALRVSASRRRAARAEAVGGRVVHEVPFERLGRNDITAALEALDRKLTPNQGLHRWTNGALQKVDGPPAGGRVLLLVHGTFSNGEQLISEFRASPAGQQFLKRAQAHYDQILSFGHPTLSVSPMLNARALALAFAGSSAQVDVVAHSRGGLVARWWVDGFERRPDRVNRVILVGVPIAGTSLASPVRLRASLNLIATFGRAVSVASNAAAAAAPFMAFVSGIFQILSSVTSLAARTPAIDAGLAMVPGLAAMQRVSNSAEIRSLRSGPDVRARYFAVRANFESADPKWSFWKLFRGLPQRAADFAADAVFDGENDLVVDSVSMDEFGAGAILPRNRVLDFGTTDEVHHTSYFRSAKTIAFLESSLLQLPG